jgi:hypothetical protein
MDLQSNTYIPFLCTIHIVRNVHPTSCLIIYRVIIASCISQSGKNTTTVHDFIQFSQKGYECA